MKKTARIICANSNEFWTTQKQFWKWVREGLIIVTGQYPLSGSFSGKRERLLARVQNVINDGSVEYDHYRPNSNIPSGKKIESNPIKIGEYLFKLFLSEKECEYVIGDLTEEYYQILLKSGATGARLWIYRQVLRSIIHLMWRVIIQKLLDQIRRLIR